MSRIGKKPILISEGVEVKIEGQKIVVKGPQGELSREIRPEIKVEVKNGKIFVLPYTQDVKKNSKYNKRIGAFWGLTRSLLNNMVEGVKKGYEKKLEIGGLGYQAFLEKDNLVLKVGFTIPVTIEGKSGVKFSVEKKIITVSGINKELVGQIAAKIRKIRPPEPYKGKGIRYLGEIVKKKAGKKVITTT